MKNSLSEEGLVMAENRDVADRGASRAGGLTALARLRGMEGSGQASGMSSWAIWLAWKAGMDRNGEGPGALSSEETGDETGWSNQHEL